MEDLAPVAEAAAAVEATHSKTHTMSSCETEAALKECGEVEDAVVLRRRGSLDTRLDAMGNVAGLEGELAVAAAQTVAMAESADKLDLQDQLASVLRQSEATEGQLMLSLDQVDLLQEQLAAMTAELEVSRQCADDFRTAAAMRQLACALPQDRLSNGLCRFVRTWHTAMVLASKPLGKQLTDRQRSTDQLRLNSSVQTKKNDRQRNTEQLRLGANELELIDRRLERAMTKRQNRHKAKGKMAQFDSAVSVIDLTTQLSMNPMQISKAGAVVQNMEIEGYSKTEINDVCRALFIDQGDKNMRKAWAVFVGNKGILSVEFFSLICVASNTEMNTLILEMADQDSSNELGFENFVKLLKLTRLNCLGD